MGLAIDKFEYSSDASAQAAYVPSTQVSFIGSTTTGTTNDSANYVNIQRFVATSSGIVKSIFIDANASGNVKVALYDQSGTAPTNLLATGSGQVANATWNAIAVTDATMINGATYYIGCAITASGLCTYLTTTGHRFYYKTITFATYAYPSPFSSTGFTVSTASIHAFQAYGVAFQAYSEATTKSEGSYSLKGVIVNTAGLGKTLTKTFT